MYEESVEFVLCIECTCTAVLTFIGYKQKDTQTNTQTPKVYIDDNTDIKCIVYLVLHCTLKQQISLYLR